MRLGGKINPKVRLAQLNSETDKLQYYYNKIILKCK